VGIRTPELLAKIDIPRQKLYYLEQKGYIKPHKTAIGDKEFREYSDEDVKKIEFIWKYLKKGFKYKIAFEKAMEELSHPQLNLVKPESSAKSESSTKPESSAKPESSTKIEKTEKPA